VKSFGFRVKIDGEEIEIVCFFNFAYLMLVYAVLSYF